ncbi:hypothetical protein BDZ97DRAFT_1764871 [Flammula alnicola]|nr:hypothetical protein BDZ97DRAFT_1764871 [Flammula alnicola]
MGCSIWLGQVLRFSVEAYHPLERPSLGKVYALLRVRRSCFNHGKNQVMRVEALARILLTSCDRTVSTNVGLAGGETNTRIVFFEREMSRGKNAEKEEQVLPTAKTPIASDANNAQESRSLFACITAVHVDSGYWEDEEAAGFNARLLTEAKNGRAL